MTTTPSAMIRLLIVDDHPVVRDGLVAILHQAEPDLEVVGEAGDGKEAVTAWRTLRPTVTIMDLQLPGQTRATRARRPGCLSARRCRNGAVATAWRQA